MVGGAEDNENEEEVVRMSCGNLRRFVRFEECVNAPVV